VGSGRGGALGEGDGGEETERGVAEQRVSSSNKSGDLDAPPDAYEAVVGIALFAHFWNTVLCLSHPC
jgi:hypothetical protein